MDGKLKGSDMVYVVLRCKGVVTTGEYSERNIDAVFYKVQDAEEYVREQNPKDGSWFEIEDYQIK